MARSAALYDLMLLEDANDSGAALQDGGRTFTISAAHTLGEVESVWRALTAGNIESPGQSFDFTRLWVDALGISEHNQFYLVARHNDTPLALLPLQRRVDKGVRVLSWFPGRMWAATRPASMFAGSGAI